MGRAGGARGPVPERAPEKVLFAHVPKAAGLHLIEYFARVLHYPRIQSEATTPDGVWRDFTLAQLRAHLHAERAFLNTHVLAFGWSELVEIVPPAPRSEIVSAIRDFRSKGWFTFTFVRHPGELLTSFYHYVLDAHRRGWHAAVARHAPVVGRTLEEFVAEHCEKELLPDYWREFDHAGVSSDESFRSFFASRFGHRYEPAEAPAHASGSRGYARYCETGEITRATRERIESSRSMEIYREIAEREKAPLGAERTPSEGA